MSIDAFLSVDIRKLYFIINALIINSVFTNFFYFFEDNIKDSDFESISKINTLKLFKLDDFNSK